MNPMLPLALGLALLALPGCTTAGNNALVASAYDRLKRFGAADRAYGRAVKLAGATPEILNNQGYSYMLRGDFKRAHRALLAARTLDPKNPYVQANLDLLQGSAQLARAGQ